MKQRSQQKRAARSKTLLHPGWAIPSTCTSLAALVWIVFGQTLRFKFINFDDGEYVYQNPHIKDGLTPSSLLWAFSHRYASNWHPLTWISHMIDWQLYGADAGGYHAGNVLLHTGVTIFLFLALRRLTGAVWRPAFVAALFAIHPLRVESVAWVSERKDVLSGLFFMLTLYAWSIWVREPSSGRNAQPGAGSRAYSAAIAFFALGLLSKPSIVTLPCVLLLLDFWPLDRFAALGWRQCTVEKVPFFALSAASSLATMLAQNKAMMPITHFPLPARLANAAWSYVAYLGQMFFPVALGVFYPLRIPPWWAVLLASACILLITASSYLLRKSHPWLLAGWLWYLGMLVPMIGIMQVGGQAHADRYTYLSEIGIGVGITWEIGAWVTRLRLPRAIIGTAAGLVLATLMVFSSIQTSYWYDSETLWRHTLSVTSGNSIGHNLLAVALLDKGRADEAMAQFQAALRINPNDAGTHLHMGVYLAKSGRLEAGIAHLRRGPALAPGDAGSEADLALALANSGPHRGGPFALPRSVAAGPRLPGCAQ